MAPEMAKAAAKKAVKTATRAVKPGRRSATAKPSKSVKVAAPAKKPVASRAPVVRKHELRAQLEKAKTTIATFRIKSRDAVRAAKASAARIAKLEAMVAQLETKFSAQEKSTNRAPVAEKPTKRRRKAPAKPETAPVEPADAEPANAETAAD
jgi:hypothetical protein